MSRGLWRLAILSCGLIGTPSLSAAETWVEVTTVAWETHAGPIKVWDARRVVLGGERNREIPAAEIVSLRFPRHRRRAVLGPCVILSNGDRFAADAVRIKDEQLTATWTQAPLRADLQFPLEAVSAVSWQAVPGRVEALRKLAELSRQPRGHDAIRLLAGERLTGEFQQSAGGLVEIATAVGPLKLDRQRVEWLALDPDLAARLPSPEVRWVAFLTDGTRITVATCEPQSDFTLQLAPVVGGRVTVPWHEVVHLQAFTRRVRPLSAREALNVRYQPYFDGAETLARDHSVAGSPLQIRGEEAATGFGMRSRMAATFALEAGDRTFASRVGIDDAADGQGSARFGIELDGREVWTSGELTGRSDPARTPAIDVAGHRELTLIVEFGDRGDVGDLADWCEPLLISSP